MSFPTKIPGLKWLTAVYVLYTFIWISLEGSLMGVILMGVGTTAVSLTYLAQHFLGSHTFSVKQWWGITAVIGLLFGFSSSVFTLFFIAVKTGLHAHGPESTLPAITWLLQQIPLWTTVGLLAGLGLGMLTSKGEN